MPDVSVQRAFQPTGLGQTSLLMVGSGTACPWCIGPHNLNVLTTTTLDPWIPLLTAICSCLDCELGCRPRWRHIKAADAADFATDAVEHAVRKVPVCAMRSAQNCGR